MTDGPSPQPELHGKDQALGYAPGKPWQIQIDVYLDDDTTDPPAFRIESCLPNYELSPGDKFVVFNNNSRPGFDVIFQLHDLTQKGYQFPRDPDDAVWSKIGDECPKSAAHEVFAPIRVVQPDQTTLVVHNENDKKQNGDPIGPFRYTLNVTRTGGKPYLHLDPGGDDQNGARTFALNK